MGFNYIVFKIEDGGFVKEIPIIYPDCLVHGDLAAAMQNVPGMEKAVPISAGSVDIACNSAHGKSSTLKLTSRGVEDRTLINAYPYFHGIG